MRSDSRAPQATTTHEYVAESTVEARQDFLLTMQANGLSNCILLNNTDEEEDVYSPPQPPADDTSELIEQVYSETDDSTCSDASINEFPTRKTTLEEKKEQFQETGDIFELMNLVKQLQHKLSHEVELREKREKKIRELESEIDDEYQVRISHLEK